MINLGETPLEWTITIGKRVRADTGGVVNSEIRGATNYVDISSYKQIRYARIADTQSQSDQIIGIAFYDSNKVFVPGSGVYALVNQQTSEYVDSVVDVPKQATYVRFSTFVDTDTYGEFYAYGITESVAAIKGLERDNWNEVYEITANDSVSVLNSYIDNTAKWHHSSVSLISYLFSVERSKIRIEANDNFPTFYALLESIPSSYSDDPVPFIEGEFERHTIVKGNVAEIKIEVPCYLYIYNRTQGGDVYFPDRISVFNVIDKTLEIDGCPADAKETGKIKVIAENNATKIGKTQIAIGDISDISIAITDWRKGYIRPANDGVIGSIGNSNNYLYTGISPSAVIKGDGKKYTFNVASGFALAQIAEYSGPTTASFVRILKLTADPMPDYLELRDGMYYAITITKSPIVRIDPSDVDGNTLVLNTYVSKVDDAQMLSTGKNLLQENDIKVGYTLGDIGEEVTDSDYKVSDFIAIPKKYTKNLLYTHAYSESGYAPIIAFYDADKSYVGQSTSGTFVQNENTYAYVKAVFPIADSECAICFSNESITPDFEPYKKSLLYKNDLNSYDKNVISDSVITEIINTGLMYIGDEQYGYGTAHTAFGESCIKTTKDTNTSSSGYDGERYQIDCSTFVLLMTMGITPECSRYHHVKNIPAQWGYRYNRLVEYEGYVYGVAQTGNTKRLYANSIAEYAYKNGYLFLVNDDMSNLRAGDIFFLSNQSSSYKFFENVGHCGMIVDTIPLEAGGQAIVTFEGNGGSNCPCKIHTYNTKLNKMIYAARFPLTNINRKVKSLTNFVQSVSIVISGDSGDAVDIATVSLSENLTTGKVYTVIAKCELPNDCYLQIKANGMSHLGVANDNIAKRPDGRRSFKIFAKNVDTITQNGSITLQAKCTGSVSGNAILTEFEVIEGYVTSFC